MGFESTPRSTVQGENEAEVERRIALTATGQWDNHVRSAAPSDRRPLRHQAARCIHIIIDVFNRKAYMKLLG